MLLAAQRAVRVTPHRATRFQQWAVELATRRGHNKAAIAIANKLARLVWAVWHRDVDFDARRPVARWREPEESLTQRDAQEELIMA